MKIKIAVLSAALVLATSAFATNFAEIGDAGQSVASAQNTGSVNPLSSITGYFDDSADVDFFNIYLTGGSFSATVSSSTDPMLFLWDSAGNALLFNDDYYGLQSYIGGSFADGQYILGISQFANGYGFHNADTGFTASQYYGANSYTINLTGANGVPDSGSTVALLGLALGAVAFLRRKN